MKKIFKAILLLLVSATTSQMAAQSITFNQYIKTVAEKNSAYLAEKYNVDIASANLQAARVFNDPELSVTYGNNEDWSMQMGQSVEVELSYSFNLGGLRRARINAASSEKEVTQAALDAYFCNLRAEACQAWAEAWRLKESCKMLRETADEMKRIAQADALRLSVGDIGSTDAMQSKLEAQALEQDLRNLEAEYANALLDLEHLMGGEKITDIADATLPESARSYNEEEALNLAEENRADLREVELSQQLSANNLKLVQASRAMELGISLGYSWNSEVRNEIAPAPKFNGFSIGISIPLKFSNTNKGEKLAAQYALDQSKQMYEAARQQVRKEVSQAYRTFTASDMAQKQFSDNMLADARTILDSRKVGYQSGDSGLVELLAAQQSYRDIMQKYIDVCAQRYISEVILQQAMGL